jgi:hypothetical protein
MITNRNHGNAGAQTSNRHGRVSLGRGAVANLRENKHSRQTETRLPRTQSQPPQNQKASITWPTLLSPQQETPPVLDSAQECSCEHETLQNFSHNITAQ